MRVFTPGEVAANAANKYLGVLVAAKHARALNEFPRDRSSSKEKKLTTRSLEELSSGSIEYRVVPRRRGAGGNASEESPAVAGPRRPSRGAQGDVARTSAAREFIGAITFEALTGRPVHTNIFEDGRALEHVKLGRDSDAIVVAPATADFLARAAGGRAGDLLGAILLAAKSPVLLVPAMNDQTWAHAQTQANVT